MCFSDVSWWDTRRAQRLKNYGVSEHWSWPDLSNVKRPAGGKVLVFLIDMFISVCWSDKLSQRKFGGLTLCRVPAWHFICSGIRSTLLYWVSFPTRRFWVCILQYSPPATDSCVVCGAFDSFRWKHELQVLLSPNRFHWHVELHFAVCTVNLWFYDYDNWLVVWNTAFIFPYIGNHNPNWLSYFSEGLKPPTR